MGGSDNKLTIMPDNVLGDVFEELKDTVGSAAQQANPLDLVEAGVQQITGQQNTGGVDEKTHQNQMTSQIKQMKTIDEKNRKPELEAIRQNLIAMMQPKAKSQSDLPKNVSGSTLGPKNIEEGEKQQEKIKKERNKLPELSPSAQSRKGSSEGGVRGMSG